MRTCIWVKNAISMKLDVIFKVRLFHKLKEFLLFHRPIANARTPIIISIPYHKHTSLFTIINLLAERLVAIWCMLYWCTEP